MPAPKALCIRAGGTWRFARADGCCDGGVCPDLRSRAIRCCATAAGLHLSGCVGDWYYVRTILRDRRIVACEDTSFGVRFFG